MYLHPGMHHAVNGTRRNAREMLGAAAICIKTNQLSAARCVMCKFV